MNRFTTLVRSALFATTLLGATAAIADPLPLTSFLTTTDPYQNGRLSRNGVPQDFAGDEAYPGVLASSLGLLYHYHTYVINVGAANYISISFDNTASASQLNSFVAAYQSAYYVTARQTSWLGDVGTASFFNTDVGYMDFVAKPFSQVVLVVNAGSAGNVGVGSANPFTIYAQASTDASYDNMADISLVAGGQVIPEPSTLLLLAPLALVVGLKSRRRRVAAVAA